MLHKIHSNPLRKELNSDSVCDSFYSEMMFVSSIGETAHDAGGSEGTSHLPRKEDTGQILLSKGNTYEKVRTQLGARNRKGAPEITPKGGGRQRTEEVGKKLSSKFTEWLKQKLRSEQEQHESLGS